MFSLVTPPSFAMSVFRLTPALPEELSHTQAEAELDTLNRAYYARLSARPDIFLTQTLLNGTFCVRFAVGAARTTEGHIDHAWQVLQDEAGIAVKEWEEARAKRIV